MHACMNFLKMIFLREELMRITFDVGSYTVQEYMRTIPRKLGKLHCFKECFDKKLRYIHSANGNSLPLFCRKSTRIELLRRKNSVTYRPLYRALQFRRD